jgi:hypothetical protein
MRKPTKPQNDQQKPHAPRILTECELQQAIGGNEEAVMKSRHETTRNSIGN